MRTCACMFAGVCAYVRLRERARVCFADIGTRECVHVRQRSRKGLHGRAVVPLAAANGRASNAGSAAGARSSARQAATAAHVVAANRTPPCGGVWCGEVRRARPAAQAAWMGHTVCRCAPCRLARVRARRGRLRRTHGRRQRARAAGLHRPRRPLPGARAPPEPPRRRPAASVARTLSGVCPPRRSRAGTHARTHARTLHHAPAASRSTRAAAARAVSRPSPRPSRHRPPRGRDAPPASRPPGAAVPRPPPRRQLHTHTTDEATLLTLVRGLVRGQGRVPLPRHRWTG